jgi:hypothetical protein
VPIPLGLKAEIGIVAANPVGPTFLGTEAAPASSIESGIDAAAGVRLLVRERASGLDQVVERRTRELAAANDELRRELPNAR